MVDLKLTENDEINFDHIKDLIGKEIVVYWSSDGHVRNNFNPQISVKGILEYNESGKNSKFRVYRSDDDDECYSYFNIENINTVAVDESLNHRTISLK